MQTNLEAHWKFEEGSGDTAFDSAGNNDGTILGTTAWITDSPTGGGLEFDGNDGRIDTGNWNPSNEDMTICFWIKQMVLDGTGEEFWVGKYEGWNDGMWMFFKRPDSDGNQIEFRESSMPTQVDFNTSVTQSWVDSWKHVALVLDYHNAQARLHVDGIHVESQPFNGYGDANTDAHLYIGGRNVGVRAVSGSMTSVRIYSRTLSEQEVLFLYENPIGLEAFFSGATLRQITSASTYSGATYRKVTSPATYSANTLRIVTKLASYSARALRSVTKLTSYSASTLRTVTALAGYSGATFRKVTSLTSYSGATLRKVVDQLIASFSGATLRKVTKATSYSGATNRVVTRLASYSGATARVVKKATLYAGATLRKLTRPATYSATTSRVVTSLASYSAGTYRVVKSAASYSAATLRVVRDAIFIEFPPVVRTKAKIMEFRATARVLSFKATAKIRNFITKVK